MSVYDSQETPSPSANPTLNHKLIARLDSAHGVHDVNAVAWCPRSGHEDLLATAADDGGVKVWRVTPAGDV
jgi:WD40 repeat protein